jgi:hypothetical protein
VSKVGEEGRSYQRIEPEDLERLADIAIRDREDFFQRHTDWAEAYADRVLAVALCQGAAQHYVDGTTGINDFDLLTFYQRNPRKHWYAKRLKYYDYGDPKFGQSVDRPDYAGRRVDCMARAIEAGEGEDVIAAVQRYLQEGKSKTARPLAQKAVVLLYPNCGTVV